MKKLVMGILLGVLATYAWNRTHQPVVASPPATDTDYPVEQPAAPPPAPPAAYRCDGRVYCSQMTSCDEAMFFLHNCPGVKMDGEGDGVPCDRQWCGSH